MWRRVLAVMTGTAVLAACGAMGNGPDRPGIDGTAWILGSLPGRDLLPDIAVTLAFDAGTAAGSDGCNRYSAPYTASGSRLDIDPRGATTMMACAAPVMEQALAYQAALARVRGYTRDDRQLALVAGDGEVLATFVAQPQGLAGTRWRVTGYNNGRQAVVSVRGDTPLSASFGDDGRVSGSAGCNSYTAPYTVTGGAITIGPAAATRRFCAGPGGDAQGVMQQEQDFLAALATAATLRREATRLELRTADGALAVSLTASP